MRTCTADGGGTHQDSELVRIEHSRSYFYFQRNTDVEEYEYAYGTIDVCPEEGCNGCSSVKPDLGTNDMFAISFFLGYLFSSIDI